MSDERHYGTDSTDQHETLAEATRLPDGTVHFEVAILDKTADDRR